MDYYAILGMMIVGVGVIIGLMTSVKKIIDPLNELKTAIEVLTANISNIIQDIKRQEERLDLHGKALDNLSERITTVETKMDIYHKGV